MSNHSARRGILLIVSAAVLAALLFAAPARAAVTPAEQSVVWDPSEVATAYDPDLRPFNDTAVSERSSFVCAFADGSTLSSQERDMMAQIVLAASKVYTGKLELGKTAAGDPDNAAPSNAGYPADRSGMQAFLANERSLLSQGHWVPYDQRELIRGEGKDTASSYATATPGWQIKLKPGSGGGVSRSQQGRIVELLPEQANHPLELTSMLPEACALDPIAPDGPQFADIFGSVGDFLVSSLLYLPASLADAGNGYLQPLAFRYTFWTPHSERGDLMWSTPAGCTPQGQAGRSFDATQLRAECSAGEHLGYDASADVQAGSTPWFISAARFIQWLLSGVYMLIFLVAVTLFMLRANRSATTNMMRMIPRIIVSMVLVVFAGYLIGRLISVSNMSVQAIFGFDQAPTVGAINTYLLQAGPISGGPEVFQKLVEVALGTSTVFFYAVFFLSALARQLVLIALIIVAPAAALCLVVPSWRRNFDLYVRTLLAVIVLPVAMALILRIGSSINPLLLDPESAYGSLQGLVGLAVMWLTMYLMYRAIKLGARYVIHGGQAFSLRPLLEGVFERKESERAGADSRPVQLVPADRAVAPQHQALLSPNAAYPLLQRDRYRASGPSAAPVQQAIQEHNPRPQTQARVPSSTAREIQGSLEEALQKAREEKGEELTAEEEERIRREHAKGAGGLLQKVRGSWYLIKGGAEEKDGEEEKDGSSAEHKSAREEEKESGSSTAQDTQPAEGNSEPAERSTD